MFLRERYIAEFNQKFCVPATEKGTALQRSGRTDLDWVFSVQTDRVVASDNTIAFRDQCWQIEKTRWRHSLAGCSVTVHEHLDGRISVRYGPHVVASWSREDTAGKRVSAVEKTGAWKPAKTKSRFPPSPILPWKSRPNREISTFPPRQRLRCTFKRKEKPRQLDRTARV